jgi:multicomponent K+:H+ antiporter subunit E
MKLLFAVLLAFWLVLNQSLAPAQVLLGSVLALAGIAVLARLEPRPGRARSRPMAVARLVALLVDDIVRSNLAVARIVLGLGPRRRTPGFLSLPLETRHPGALAAMAVIITATPGTSWVGYDAERNTLTIHVLDLADEDAWTRFFKQRYERMLMEIFE